MAEVGLFKVLMPSMAINMVGTPWKAVIFSWLMQSRPSGGRRRGWGHGDAVGHGGGHSQHHAEAVEHGHLNHHPVGGGQIHAVADGLAVVDHVVVGEHNALGEAGGAGGVLHIADVVLVDGMAAAVDLLQGNLGQAMASSQVRQPSAAESTVMILRRKGSRFECSLSFSAVFSSGTAP